MRATITTLFVIAMLIASTQTFRHIYVKWIQSNSSVLDEFKDRSTIKAESQKSMSELVKSYREAKKEATLYEKDKTNLKIKSYNKRNVEPYKTEHNIRREITSREYDKNNLRRLKFYWFAGIISIAIGLLTMIKFNPWLGFSGIVVGISEMLVWTSPLFFNKSLNPQFVSLLNYKLTLSLISWIIIVVLWLFFDKKILPKNGKIQ